MFPCFLESDKIYEPKDISEVLRMSEIDINFIKNTKKIEYLNLPVAFDIESSSFYRSTGKEHEPPEKIAIMYEWTFGFNGLCIIGRKWNEFFDMIHKLSSLLSLYENRRIIVYVQSLSFEFQFIRKWIEWIKVFSLELRKPIYALTDFGIEFRCSYLLSGYSLFDMGENLIKYKCQKMVGDLDYKKIRNSKTPLTSEEIGYCIHDVKVVMCYIQERIEEGDITQIPLTKTGYVRNFCRQSCFKGGKYKYKDYHDLISGLTLDMDEYRELKRAFQGGFTHASPFFSGKTISDVTSYDFTSSYPFVMVSEKFPMSKGERIKVETEEELEKNLKKYCCVFDIEFTNLESVLYYDSYISQSRCQKLKDSDKVKIVINNGRVVQAGVCKLTITEQDYMIIRKFYKAESKKISNFIRYRKDYLPTDFVKAILTLYKDKTRLKGIIEEAINYLRKKEMLNSCYGMTVTDIIRAICDYINGKWVDNNSFTKDELEEKAIKQLQEYNDSKSRFLFYAWGVWVTAYARRNLFSGIIEFAGDYLYADTDSSKIRNAEKHIDYINRYNDIAREKLKKALFCQGIPFEMAEPETNEGEKKLLGVWDFDGHYEKFKTLGAKRYLVKYSSDPRNKKKLQGKTVLTVAGVRKDTAVIYMDELAKYQGKDIFDIFENNLYIPTQDIYEKSEMCKKNNGYGKYSFGISGKNTHTYIDEEKTGYVTDYLGNTEYFHELSSVHIEESDYSLSISQEYADYIACIQEMD